MRKISITFGQTSGKAANQLASIIDFLERVFVIVLFLLFTGVVGHLASGGVAGESSQISRVLSNVLSLITVPLLFINREKAFHLLLNARVLLLLIGLACLSTFWSESYSVSARASIVTLRYLAFALYFVARFTPREQLQLLAWALGIGAVLSLAFAIGAPEYAIMGRSARALNDSKQAQEVIHAGTWKGLYGHKNALARIMVLSVVTFMALAMDARRYRLMYWFYWAFVALSTALVYLSTSRSGFLVLAILVLSFPIYRKLQSSSGLTASIGAALFVIVSMFSLLFVTTNVETALGALGRDMTFTGRTELWEVSWNEVMTSPWLGHGYNAYWGSELAYRIWVQIGWATTHSHNGFLDAALDIGLIGVGLILINLLDLIIRTIRWMREDQSSISLWFLVFITFLIAYNMSESSLLRQPYTLLLFMIVSLAIPRDATDRGNRLVKFKF